MHCPFCGHEDSKVTDSRLSQGGTVVRRRRACDACGRRFTTYERLEHVVPGVVKRDQSRQAFDRDKVTRGVTRACVKRPVALTAIEALVSGVERKLAERGEREVSAADIGELVMEALRGLDRVAYVRYASVYRQFTDVQEFAETLTSLGDTDGDTRD